MADYINPQFESDPFTIEADVYSYIQSVFPNFDPKAAGVVRILTEAFAAQTSELIRLATDVPPAIFRYFGGLVGILPQEAEAATVDVMFTALAVDAVNSRTVPAGTGIEIPRGDGTSEPFTTIEDGVILAGQTTVSGVQAIAMNEGSQASGLSGPAVLADVYDFLSSTVTLATATTGGVDAETDDDYLARLSSRLTLLADHPVVPDDFVTYSLSVPGVARAVALDGYNPADGTYNNDKMITMVAFDSTGTGIPSGTKTTLKNTLQAAREVNFVVNVTDPTYTVVTVVSQVKAEPNVDLPTLKASVEAAILSYLSPPNWGRFGSGDSTSFRVDTKVRYTNIVAVIENVPGVDYIVPGTLTINGSAGDLTLPGAVPVPGPINVATITAVA